MKEKKSVNQKIKESKNQSVNQRIKALKNHSILTHSFKKYTKYLNNPVNNSPFHSFIQSNSFTLSFPSIHSSIHRMDHSLTCRSADSPNSSTSSAAPERSPGPFQSTPR